MISSQAASGHEGSATARSFPPAGLAWVVWGIAAIFYLGVFFLRAAPAVMTSELMRLVHQAAAARQLRRPHLRTRPRCSDWVPGGRVIRPVARTATSHPRR